MKGYLTNGKVAWQVPGKITPYYRSGYYLPWGGWVFTSNLTPDWREGECGEWRIQESQELQHAGGENK